MKNIALAIQKEREYLNEKINNGNNKVNIHDYLDSCGYSDLEEFGIDKFWYKVANCNIVSVTDSATILQPLAYTNYQNATPFCYFVEYNKPFALVPISLSQEDENRYEENGLDCFKPGYDTSGGGVIITHNDDFRFCICVPYENNYNDYFFKKSFETVKKYYPDVYADGNDMMYGNRKVCGTVTFSNDSIIVFAMNLSLVDMSETINNLGITKAKQPGYLPYMENIKNTLKEEVKLWLRL
jgi:lipoate-protein ligase A